MKNYIDSTITGMDKLIAALCLESFKKSNPSGKRNRSGRFNPYSVPSDAQELVSMKQGVYDGSITEEQAKGRMMCIRQTNNMLS